MYLDPDRNLYKQFQLPRTMKNVWNIDSLKRYAEFICNDRELFDMEEGDDPHQLGGDFIVDSQGILKFIHRSKTTIDRPTVKDLLFATSS